MTIEIPVIDLSRHLKTGDDEHACKQAATAMEELGLFIIRDPRVDPGLPVRYRDMMQSFYRLPPEVKAKYIQEPQPDGTQLYETGWRPPNTEAPRRRDEILPLIPADMRPPESPPADLKERFMDPNGPLS